MRTNYTLVHYLLRKSRCILWNRDTNGEKNIERPLYLSISIPCVYDINIYIIY